MTDIGEILESNFNMLDDLFLINEGKDVFGEYEKHRFEPDYLYLELERLMRDPKIGTYLSPASWLKKRSMFFLDRFDTEKNKIIESGEQVEDIDDVAWKKAEEGIKNEIESRREELEIKYKGISPEQINTIINREMPLHVNVPTFHEISVDSQTSRNQDVYVDSAQIGSSDIPLDDAIGASYAKKSERQGYLEAMRKIVMVRDADNVWHEANIARMVIFGDGRSMPPRLVAKIREYEDEIARRTNKIKELREVGSADSLAEADKLEEERTYYEKQRGSIAVGAWRPTDLNRLVYGSETPPSPALAHQNQNNGLMPNLCYRIGAKDSKDIVKSYSVYGYEMKEEEKEVRSFYDSEINTKIKNARDSEEDTKEAIIKRFEQYRETWLDSNGDLSKAPLELYNMVVKFIMDRIPYLKEGLEKAYQRAQQLGDQEQIEQRNAALSTIRNINAEDESNDTVVIGAMRFNKMKSGDKYQWAKEGRDITDPRNKKEELKNVHALYDVGLDNDYNLSSVMKRTNVAQLMSEAIDRSVYQWVLNKVCDSVLKSVEPDHASVLNIGSDPRVVNHFMGSMDQLEDRYGIGAKMSWFLIPFIDMHKANANRLLSNARVDNTLKTKKNDFGDERLSFDTFNQMPSGVMEKDTKVVHRDKSGNPIKVTGYGFDHYIKLAILRAQESEGFDSSQLNTIIDKIEDSEDATQALGEKINEIDKRIKISDDEVEIAELQTEAEELRSKMNLEKTRFENLSKAYDEYWLAIVEEAQNLQKMGPKAIEDEGKRLDKFSRASFDKWLDRVRRDVIHKDHNEQEPWEQEVTARIEEYDAATSPEEKKEIWDELYDQFKNAEPFSLTEDEKLEIYRIKDVYGDANYAQIAKIAAQRIEERTGNKTEIDEDQVELALGEKKSQKNILSQLIGAVKERAGVRKLKTVSDIQSDEDINMTVESIVETITAIVETSIVTSSQTRIEKGGGLKTDIIYKDEHGVVHLPPQWDPGLLGVNPIEAIHQLNDEKVNIEKSDEDEESKREKIKNINLLIAEHRRRMDDNPSIKELALRARDVAGPANPFISKYVEEKPVFEDGSYKLKHNCMLASLKVFDGNEELEPESISPNGDSFVLSGDYADLRASYIHVPIDSINDKIKRKLRGKEVEFSDNDKNYLEFMHRHTPTMQSMGINMARVAGRYILPIQRSIDVAGVTGMPPSNSKDITDLGAMQTANVLYGLVNFCNAGKYLKSINASLEQNKELRKVIHPRVVPQLAVELSRWAAGAKMKGGMDEQTLTLTIDFIKSRLLEYARKGDGVNQMIDSVAANIARQMIDLSAPTEEDLQTRKDLYANTSRFFSDLLQGTKNLIGEDGSILMPYHESEMSIIENLIKSIEKMRKGEKVKGIRKQIRDFIDLSNDLAIDKDAEEVFSDTIEDFDDIEKLDNLMYLIKMHTNISATASRLDPEKRAEYEESKGLGDIKSSMSELISELDAKGIDIREDSKFEEIIIQIGNYRNDAVNKIQARIDRYSKSTLSQEQVGDMLSRLSKLRVAINSSEAYHNERYVAKTATKEEDRIRAEEAMKTNQEEISKSFSSLGLKTAELEGNVHSFMSDETLGIVDKYRKERRQIYDAMINARNNIIGVGHGVGVNKKQRKEAELRIYKTIAAMTKHYNMTVDEVADELENRVTQFEKGMDFKAQERHAAEKAFGGIETSAIIRIDKEEFPATIYPRKQVQPKFQMLPYTAAYIMDPARLLDDENTKIKVPEISDEWFTLVMRLDDKQAEKYGDEFEATKNMPVLIDTEKTTSYEPIPMGETAERFETIIGYIKKLIILVGGKKGEEYRTTAEMVRKQIAQISQEAYGDELLEVVGDQIISRLPPKKAVRNDKQIDTYRYTLSPDQQSDIVDILQLAPENILAKDEERKKPGDEVEDFDFSGVGSYSYGGEPERPERPN